MRDTKDHILKVALSLFLQKNYKEVTMRELVEKSGLSKGAFYHYFNSKEQLFLEVVKSCTDFIYIIFSQLDQSSLYNFYHSYADNLNKRGQDSFIEQMYFESYSNSINFFTVIFDAIKMFPDIKQNMVKARQEELAIWTNIISNARKNGEIVTSMTNEQVANIFTLVGDGIGIQLVITDERMDAPEEILKIWDSFYLSIKA